MRLPSPVTKRKSLTRPEQIAIAKAGARIMRSNAARDALAAVLLLQDAKSARNAYRRAAGLPEV